MFPVNNFVFVNILVCFTEEGVGSVNSFNITRKYSVYQVWGGEENETEQVTNNTFTRGWGHFDKNWIVHGKPNSYSTTTWSRCCRTSMKIVETPWASNNIKDNLWKSQKILEHLRKSKNIYVNQWKSINIDENRRKSKNIYETQPKTTTINANPWNSMKIYENQITAKKLNVNQWERERERERENKQRNLTQKHKQHIKP